MFGDKLTNDSEEIRESTLEILKLFDPSAATRRAVHVRKIEGMNVKTNKHEQMNKYE